MNENGAFSFNEPWRFSHPSRFPTSYLPARQRHVLSPFWSDIDIRKKGTVRYIGIERGVSAVGDAIMNETSAYINERFDTRVLEGDEQGSFEPIWVLVAQWDKVHPHPHGSENLEGIDEDILRKVSANYLYPVGAIIVEAHLR